MRRCCVSCRFHRAPPQVLLVSDHYSPTDYGLDGSPFFLRSRGDCIGPHHKRRFTHELAEPAHWELEEDTVRWLASPAPRVRPDPSLDVSLLSEALEDMTAETGSAPATLALKYRSSDV